MNAIKTLCYDDAGVRVVIVDGEPWFSAADVCTLLEIGNPVAGHDSSGRG